MATVKFTNSLGNFGQISSFLNYENMTVTAFGHDVDWKEHGNSILVMSDSTTDADVIFHGLIGTEKDNPIEVVYLHEVDFFNGGGDLLMSYTFPKFSISNDPKLEPWGGRATDLEVALTTQGVNGMLEKLYSKNDTFIGSNNSDYIFSGAGNDIIKAGKGNDWLIGEAGNDRLYGQAGNDTFISGFHNGHDTVVDFDTHKGEHDLIGVTTGYHLKFNADKTILNVDYGNGDRMTVQLGDHHFAQSDLYHF